MERFPVIVVGGGPAGLAASQQLSQRGIVHVVLERGDTVGHVWRNLYDSLTLHTGRHLSALPGMPFPKGTPLFPTRQHFVDYLDAYVARFDLPVRTRVAVLRANYVRAADTDEGSWSVETTSGVFVCRVLICAAGIVSTPVHPDLPGRDQFAGTVAHAWTYRRPGPFVDKRVLVVGVGNTGGEVASEIGKVAAHVDISVRSGAMTVPRTVLGLPTQYQGWVLAYFPRWVVAVLSRWLAWIGGVVRGPSPLPPAEMRTDCPDVPLIGFSLVDAIGAGEVGVRSGAVAFTADGVRFSDGTEGSYDHVIFATGYRATMGFLEGSAGADAVGRDGCGFGRRNGRVESADRPGLFYVGHNYDSRGGLYNIAIDAKRMAKRVERSLV